MKKDEGYKQIRDHTICIRRMLEQHNEIPPELAESILREVNNINATWHEVSRTSEAQLIGAIENLNAFVELQQAQNDYIQPPI